MAEIRVFSIFSPASWRQQESREGAHNEGACHSHPWAKGGGGKPGLFGGGTGEEPLPGRQAPQAGVHRQWPAPSGPGAAAQRFDLGLEVTQPNKVSPDVLALVGVCLHRAVLRGTCVHVHDYQDHVLGG